MFPPCIWKAYCFGFYHVPYYTLNLPFLFSPNHISSSSRICLILNSCFSGDCDLSGCLKWVDKYATFNHNIMSEMTKETCFSLVPPQLHEGGPLRQRKREGSEVWLAQINQEATPVQEGREGWSGQGSREGWLVQGAERGDQSGWAGMGDQPRWAERSD